jgi:hypothetical protein
MISVPGSTSKLSGALHLASGVEPHDPITRRTHKSSPSTPYLVQPPRFHPCYLAPIVLAASQMERDRKGQPVWTRRSLNVECRNSAVHRRAPSDHQRPVRVILFDRRNHTVQLGEVFFPKSETSDNSGESSKRPSRHLISSFTTPCSRKGNHIAHMVSS